MIMMGLYSMNQIPFNDILIHGLVRDSQGRKMSKSLGNTMDPLELSEKHGADALRFSLIEKANPGQDVPFDEEWTEAAKKFGNKVWNASKFVHIYTENIENKILDEVKLVENRWIVRQFNECLKQFNELFDNYKISDAYKLLYNFLWSDLFDWYFEFSKNLIEDESTKHETQSVLLTVFTESLKILNPAMPHITEEIWSTFNDTFLIDKDWPEKITIDETVLYEVGELKNVINQIRNFKNNYSLKNNLVIELSPQRQYSEWFIFQLERIAKVKILESGTSLGSDEITLVFQSSEFKFEVLASKYIDIESERKRLNNKMAKIKNSLLVSEKRLSNDKFINNAKQELVQAEKENVKTLTSEIETIEETLSSFDK
jgi:valyl-tRNA synthetase